MTDTAPWAGGIAALTLLAEDLEASRRFYRDALGLAVRFEDDDSVVFDVGSTMINVLRAGAAPELFAPAAPGGAGTGPRQLITVHVPDVDALCAELTARGVELLNGPMDRPWGPRTASFRDPAGHVWEIAS